MTCHRCGNPGHWAQECRVPVWHIGKGDPPDQEQADQDNNEELPQDLTWDWYYKGEEGHGHEVNYMEESWNDCDYDSQLGLERQQL